MEVEEVHPNADVAGRVRMEKERYVGAAAFDRRNDVDDGAAGKIIMAWRSAGDAQAIGTRVTRDACEYMVCVQAGGPARTGAD